jgi:hypothetical protein
MFTRRWGGLSAGLVIVAIVAISVVIGVADALLLLCILGMLVASYAARRHGRDRLLYRRRRDAGHD